MVRNIDPLGVAIGILGMSVIGRYVFLKTREDMAQYTELQRVLAEERANTDTGPLITIAEKLGMSPELSRRMCTTPEQVQAWNERHGTRHEKRE